MEAKGNGVSIGAAFLVIILLATFAGCALWWNNLSKEPKVVEATAETITGIGKAFQILLMSFACAAVLIAFLFFGGPAIYNWYHGRADLKRSQTIRASVEERSNGARRAELEAAGYEVRDVKDALSKLPEGAEEAIKSLAARFDIEPKALSMWLARQAPLLQAPDDEASLEGRQGRP